MPSKENKGVETLRQGGSSADSRTRRKPTRPERRESKTEQSPRAEAFPETSLVRTTASPKLIITLATGLFTANSEPYRLNAFLRVLLFT